MLAFAVIDTSVWVSAFLNPRGYPGKIRYALREGKFNSVSSWSLINELSEVLVRPRLVKSRRLQREEIQSYILDVIRLSTVVTVRGSIKLCRDPNDDMVLETAVIGQAAFVVSRDEDLTRDLDLKTNAEKYGIQLVTVNHFWQTLAGG